MFKFTAARWPLSKIHRRDAEFTMAIVGRAFFQWCIVTVLARLGGPIELGIYTAALSLASPIIIFAELGFRNIYAAQDSVPELRVAYYMRIAMLLLAVAVTTAIGVIYFGIDTELLVALSSLKAIESLTDLSFIVDQRQNDMRRPAIAIMTSSFGGAVFFSITLFITSNLTVAIMAMSVVAVLVLIWRFYAVRKRLHEDLGLVSRNQDCIWLVKAGVATGGGQALGSLGAYLPVFYLASYGGDAEVGLYSTISYFLIIAQLLMSSMQQVRLNRARSYRGQWRKNFLRSSCENAMLALPAAIITYFGVYYFLPIIYGSQFSATQEQAIYLVCAILVLPITYGSATVMLVEGMFTSQLLSTLIALVFAVMYLFTFGSTNSLDFALGITVAYVCSRALVGLILISRLSVSGWFRRKLKLRGSHSVERYTE